MMFCWTFLASFWVDIWTRSVGGVEIIIFLFKMLGRCKFQNSNQPEVGPGSMFGQIWASGNFGDSYQAL